jgi:hypothetical protein
MAGLVPAMTMLCRVDQQSSVAIELQANRRGNAMQIRRLLKRLLRTFVLALAAHAPAQAQSVADF